MRKAVTARVHGVLDYATVAAFLNAPMVFGFHGTPAAIVYWLAGIHLLMTGCTDVSVRTTRRETSFWRSRSSCWSSLF